MAKEYLEKLAALIDATNIEKESDATIETKHFFSGAALYINATMCASLSPVGLAFKLSALDVSQLINSGKAKPLQYFPKGYINKGYALFENPDLTKTKQWQKYFLKAIKHV
ncbi:MAG: hypothetical protein V3T17_16560 [Pseudomonadales bacterium]